MQPTAVLTLLITPILFVSLALYFTQPLIFQFIYLVLNVGALLLVLAFWLMRAWIALNGGNIPTWASHLYTISPDWLKVLFAVPFQGSFIIGALAIIPNPDESNYLFVKRTYGSEPWALPGGATKWNEPPRKTVLRELKEELTISTNEVTVGGVQAIFSSGRELDLFFFCRLSEEVLSRVLMLSSEGKLSSSEICEAGLFPVENLPAGTFTRHKKALEEFVKPHGPLDRPLLLRDNFELALRKTRRKRTMPVGENIRDAIQSIKGDKS